MLSEIKITSLSSLAEAVSKLHKTHRIPHIIVTSTHLPDDPSTMSIIGSTSRSDFSSRLFKIDVPAIDCFFSGTGDMFAALAVVRLREAVTDAKLNNTKSWVSPDDVKAVDLPLAKAAKKVLGSMHTILSKTKTARDKELEGMGGPQGAMEREKDSEKRLGLRRAKAAEVKVVRCLGDLREPSLDWKVEAVEEGGAGAGAEASEIPHRGAVGAMESPDLGMQHPAGQGDEHEPRTEEHGRTIMP